jgi:hypothetical protein
VDPELYAEAQVLFGLWSVVAHAQDSETQKFVAAHQELISHLESPATIFPSFALVLRTSTSPDILVRRGAILGINLRVRSGPEYSAAQIQWIRSRFVDVILYDTNSLCQMNLCEAVVDFVLRTPEWPELVELPSHLLQSDVSLACGLGLWHLLISSGNGELVDITQFAVDLVRTSLACFESPMRDVRIHALVLLEDLVWRSGDWASVHDEVTEAVT